MTTFIHFKSFLVIQFEEQSAAELYEATTTTTALSGIYNFKFILKEMFPDCIKFSQSLFISTCVLHPSILFVRKCGFHIHKTYHHGIRGGT